jgi:hypothetical protein
MKSNVSVLLTSDDLPCPVVIHRQHDGRVVELNSEAKKLFSSNTDSDVLQIDRLITQSQQHPARKNTLLVTCRSLTNQNFDRRLKRKEIV